MAEQKCCIFVNTKRKIRFEKVLSLCWLFYSLWTGTSKAGVKYKGTIEVPNLSDENDMEDLDVSFTRAYVHTDSDWKAKEQLSDLWPVSCPDFCIVEQRRAWNAAVKLDEDQRSGDLPWRAGELRWFLKNRWAQPVSQRRCSVDLGVLFKPSFMQFFFSLYMQNSHKGWSCLQPTVWPSHSPHHSPKPRWIKLR